MFPDRVNVMAVRGFDGATAMGKHQYHVFLSHSSRDKPSVEELALWLVREGLTPFFDAWELVPGEDWTDALPKALDSCATCAVIIGPGDSGGWQRSEVKQALIRSARERNFKGGERFRIIPILLPGASDVGSGEPSAFDFLAQNTWIKFERSLDETEMLHRLVCGIRGVAPGPPPQGAIEVGECPYRGLDVFDIGHAHLFFGREKLTRDLVAMLGTILDSPGPRLLAVVGPSGSGKSSIVRAGLIPVLQKGALSGSERWQRLIFKPGQDPFENLGIGLATLPAGASLLQETRSFLGIKRFGRDDHRSLHMAARLATRNDSTPTRVLVVVDQFEEIFTQCSLEADRQKLIANLIEAATVLDGPVVVVLSLRADFLGKCASYRDLADAVSGRQRLIGEMVEDELRWAIEKPAALASGEIEPGLVEQLLQDVGSEPGSLPLLEFALSELWRQKTGRRMVIQDYRDIGGLRGALKKHAETVLDGLKKRGLEEVCRRIFLDLIEPGKGAGDTRKRVRYRQLAISTDWITVVETLVRERLVTTDKPDDLQEGTAEIVHESLIKYWTTLQDWVNKNRERMEIRSELEAAADKWIKYHRDSDSLLRGLPLANALEWARTNPDDLARLTSVSEFLDCSKRAEVDREQDELRQERRLREEAEAAASYQKKLRHGSLISAAAVLTVVALAVWIEVAGRRLIAKKRADGRQSVFQAQLAMSKADWHGAKVHLTGALAVIAREPALAAEAREAEQLRAEVDRKLAERTARQVAHARRTEFDSRRDEVLFLATQSLDADSAKSRERAGKAAQVAFASVGLALDAPGQLVLDPSFAPEERDAIISGGYELLLVLADSLAQPLSRQTVLDRRSRVVEALGILDRAATLRPPTRAYYLRKARCLAFLGDEIAAREQTERAGGLPTVSATEAFLAGVDVFIGADGPRDRQGLAEATRCFEQALRSQPDHFWARYYLAVCALNTGHHDLAAVYLTACLAQRPGFVWIHLLRGFALGELHEFDAAEADFRKVSELHPDEDARYALFVNRAALKVAQGMRPDAAVDLERAVALKPDRYRAYVNLALLCKGDHRYAEAARHLDTAIRLNPPDLVMTTLHAEQAHLLLLMKKPAEALNACDVLLKLRPGAAEVLGVRAAALLKLGRYSESVGEFTVYLERGGTPSADIYSGRGQARMKLGDYQGAVDDYTRALGLKPDWEIQMHRGWAYFSAEAPQLALRDFETALRLSPSSVETLIGRGLARVTLSQDATAVADANEALKRPPGDPMMLHNIACIFGRAASRKDPAGQYRRHAVSALRLALKQLPAHARKPFWRDKVLPDSYLDAIRQSPEFLELGERTEQDHSSAIP
jgi:tetratricopeptide (TPR) repeat protein